MAILYAVVRGKRPSSGRRVSVPPDTQAFARQFVQSLMERYAAYHNHKETMAYGGLTVFGGAVVAAVASNWPPDWGPWTPTLAPVAALFLFAVTLIYLRYQLHRRRWAALRVAGCEHVLARWVRYAPTTDDLESGLPTASPVIPLRVRMADWIWPQGGTVRAIESAEVRISDAPNAIYPRVLVDAWMNAGTSALKHERLIIVTTWFLGLVLLLRSWACPPCRWWFE